MSGRTGDAARSQRSHFLLDRDLIPPQQRG
jgi:hypothetical protein